MKRVARLLASAVTLVTGCVGVCHAQTAASVELGLRDVRARVEGFDPLLRARAWERMRARIDLGRAEWNRVQGVMGVLVSASAGADTVGQTGGGNAADATQKSAMAVVDIRVPLYAGGGINAGIDAARARLEAAEGEQMKTQRELTRMAFVAYAKLLGARGQLEVASGALARSARLVDVAVARVESGLASDADVTRAELARAKWLDEVALRDGDVAVALAVLKSALLLEDATDIKTTDSLDALRDLRSVGSPRRPDVEAANALARALRADREVAASGYLPRVEIFAQGLYGNAAPTGAPAAGASPSGVSSPTPVALGGFQGAGVVGSRLSWTIFDFFVTRDAVNRAETSASVASALANEQARRARAERGYAAAKENGAQQRRGALSGVAQRSSNAVEMTRRRYETGNATLTDVLSTELEMTDIATRSVQGAVELAIAHVERLVAEGFSP